MIKEYVAVVSNGGWLYDLCYIGDLDDKGIERVSREDVEAVLIIRGNTPLQVKLFEGCCDAIKEKSLSIEDIVKFFSKKTS